MYSIGLDVSKSSINIFISREELDLEIENNSKALNSLYSKLKKIYKKEIDKVVFVFEPTGSYSELLHQFCASKNIQIFMINPKQARNFSKAIAQRNKSDVIDARVLAQAISIARKNEIRIPTINPIVEEIKELMSYYKLKVKQRVQLSNHLEALSVKNSNKTLVKTIQKELKALKNQEETIIETINSIINKDEVLLKKYNAIISIKGIGNIAAIVLLHLFIKYSNANQRQIVSLTGLDPVVRESGTSVRGRSKISKAGARIYRGTLFMAAIVATIHNKQMKSFYERLKKKDKHTTVAQIAVIRKLVIIAHSLYKNEEMYDEDKYMKSTGVSNV
ncbi:MAG: IS110 family transposase [uncultured Sulfurovum sp.]|uniref:IS110 family transposase n=1 Tax=uncultured Sulfurovum sp. TaxID=269237 RepID=A0A6S6SF70_9BACT|nr:MAG: IS110 family transposase [uncultured Sulfurovum sp.]